MVRSIGKVRYKIFFFFGFNQCLFSYVPHKEIYKSKTYCVRFPSRTLRFQRASESTSADWLRHPERRPTRVLDSNTPKALDFRERNIVNLFIFCRYNLLIFSHTNRNVMNKQKKKNLASHASRLSTFYTYIKGGVL